MNFKLLKKATKGAHVVRKWLFVSVCVFAASGCVPLSHPGGSQGQPASAQSAATKLAPGFYRNSDGATVFKVDMNNAGCVVRDPDQMNTFGGFAKVTVLDSSVNIAGSLANKPAYCAWPDGNYRIAGDTNVYRVKQGHACRVTDPARASKVRPVTSAAHLLPSADVANC